MSKTISNVRNTQKASNSKDGSWEVPKKDTTSTKNNIRHFAPVIKRILLIARKSGYVTEEEMKETSKKLDKATSLKKFVDSYSLPTIRNILQESVISGLFVRIFLEAQIYDSNKVKDLKHLDRLFESFHTGVLDRWVYYPDGKKSQVKTSSQSESAQSMIPESPTEVSLMIETDNLSVKSTSTCSELVGFSQSFNFFEGEFEMGSIDNKRDDFRESFNMKLSKTDSNLMLEELNFKNDSSQEIEMMELHYLAL